MGRGDTASHLPAHWQPELDARAMASPSGSQQITVYSAPLLVPLPTLSHPSPGTDYEEGTAGALCPFSSR